MQRYLTCPDCNGVGHFSCRNCICPQCGGSGTLSCKMCKSGSLICRECNARGNIRKRILFVSYTSECTSCNGSGKIPCRNCNASGEVLCIQCNGKGRISPCPECGDTFKIKCRQCSGSGKIEDQEFIDWLRVLSNYPLSRLRHEIDKRQRKIQQLQTKILHLGREVDQIYSEHQDDLMRNPGAFVHGGYPCGLDLIPREIRGLENDIDEIEEEISIVEGMLDKKWR